MTGRKKTHYFSFITTKRHNNQNRHSEGGTTAETLSNYLKIQRCDLDDVNWQQKEKEKENLEELQV
jgi:diketogulonate reductase-like aldo/keto reductase